MTIVNQYTDTTYNIDYWYEVDENPKEVRQWMQKKQRPRKNLK